MIDVFVKQIIRLPRRVNSNLIRLGLMFALFLFCTPVLRAQTYYVFKNGSNYLVNNGGTLGVSANFAPNAVWQANSTLGGTSRNISSYTNNTQYLRGSANNNSAVSLGASQNVWYDNDGVCTRGGGTFNRKYYYTTYDGSAFKTVQNAGVNQRFIPTQVTVSTVNDQISNNVTINGLDVLESLGNHNYGHSAVTYRKGYTTITLNSTTYRYTGNTAETGFNGAPANATPNYEWSLTSSSYATVNSSTGTVTVSSLPENDVTLTLTLRVTATGGIPEADPAFELTDSKTITIQGTKPSAPYIQVNGNTVTLGTYATGSCTIRYTTDGSTPSASSGTQYSSPFTLTSDHSPVTIKAVTVRGGNVSNVSTQVVTLTLPAPSIITDVEAGTATINTSVPSAVIHYTTDGTTPTASSPVYSAPISGLGLSQTVKAIAVADGWSDSPVSSATMVKETGVTDGIVTLFDYEDHSWSYYSDPENPIHSWNPADVKITYFGNGNGTVSANNDDAPTSFTANATGVKVGIDANAHTFVYYSTLERTDGRTAATPDAAIGRCAYTTIQNPFSVRPTYGANANEKYRGFYKWRIKSLQGGSIYSAATGGTNYGVGAMIDSETQLYFAPDSEYGMEVEFEALWARAYVSTSATGLRAAVGVERNFCMFTASASSNITPLNVPCTYTSIYPNGTTNGTTPAPSVTVYKYGGFTASTDSKIEYIQLRNNNSTINANGKNFTIGRGVSGYGGGVCAANLYGLNANSTTSFRFNIASGSYSNLYFLGSGRTFSNGILTSVVGCDYDRAINQNNNLNISTDILVGNDGTVGSNRVGQEVFYCTVKSGDFDLNSYGGDYQFYLSAPNGDSYGKRILMVEGGIFSDIAGGIDVDNTTIKNSEMVSMRIKGGTINGAVFGAAQHAAGYGDRRIVITGGDFKGWIAGGANGTSNSGGVLTGKADVYVGGTANVNSNGSQTPMNRAIGGNVFGAGCGYNATSSSGQVTRGTTVVIADEAYIERGVYGGGSYGFCSTDQTANIYILGGTVAGEVGGLNGTTYSGQITGGVFGGACQNKGGTANIYMKGGTVKGGLYGGSNATGTLSGDVTIRIDGGQVGTAESPANAHGGGYGEGTVVNGNVSVTVGTLEQTEEGAVVYGDVYGGSALGKTNGTTATNSRTTSVTLNKGTVNGSVYGGALGSAGVAANVYGPVTVTVNGGSVRKTAADGSGAVYGCNNINGAPQRTVSVTINGTDPAPNEDSYALYAVYGGGNRADYTYNTPTVVVNNCDNSIEYLYGGGNAAQVNATDVTIWGGNTIGNVFGGGNGTVDAANVVGNTNVKIYGGTIEKVYGGSNSQGSIGGTINVTVESMAAPSKAPCLMDIGDVYGGGNMAPSRAGNITINCTGSDGHIDRVFGGANAADITGNIDLQINAGNIGTVFGGNNASGNISGTVTVTVGNAPEECGVFQIDTVYGGGNLAAYSVGGIDKSFPKVNILNGTITGSVYGGGLGESAVITGNPVVTVSGGNVGNLYGGGNAASVTGNTTVLVNGGTVGSAERHANVFGGGYGASTQVSGNVTVNIGTTGNIASPSIYGDVYGGSALGNVNGSTANLTQVNLLGGTIHGDAYGGGLGSAENAALVNGNVTVTQNGTAFVLTTKLDDNGNPVPASGRIFGCNNLNGTPLGTVLVRVNKTVPAGGGERSKGSGVYDLNAVYGGGNLAVYEPTNTNATGQYTDGGHDAAGKPVQVVVDNCDDASIEFVYGGGNAASTPSTDVLVLSAYEIGSAFGGGNGKDRIFKNEAWSANPGANVGYKANGTTEYGTGKSKVSVLGGTVHYIFGGSNTLGNIRTNATAHVDGTSHSCPLVIDEVYGAGNEAYMDGSSQIELGCVDYLKSIYGGAKNANINDDILLTITSGHFDRVFGGNNLGGVINGSITVIVEETGCNPITIGELYGCGNQAPYTTPESKSDPTINIKSFTSIGTVYGGGLGAPAVVTGNPTININCVVGDNAGESSIYAGTKIDYADGSSVTLPQHTTGQIGAIGTVFGGGNAALVDGSTYVNIGTLESVSINSTPVPVVGANIIGNVYGGGNAANVSGSTNVVIGQ